MTYYELLPEVPGQLGKRTVLDNTSHPPIVGHLHFIFDGWLGDALVECFPCYLITKSLQRELELAKLNGFEINADIEIEYSDVFLSLYPNRDMPEFVRLFINGRIGDDFLIDGHNKLLASEKALNILNVFGNLKHCEVKDVTIGN